LIIDVVVSKSRQTRLKMENMELELNHLMAKEAQLRNQLHPHFLFNALFTLKLLMDNPNKRQQADYYLNRLSSFLRNSIRHGSHDTITTAAELDFCLGYLELQKVRFGDALDFKVEVSDKLLNQTNIPIFSLQLLVENAIKHNAFSKESPLEIRIEEFGEHQLQISNNLQPKQVIPNDSSGLGLTNLKNRFALLGFKEPVLHQGMEPAKFVVTLNVLPIAP
ncbi:MAG: histidine kinase, partial [Bacteroidota bacterium]